MESLQDKPEQALKEEGLHTVFLGLGTNLGNRHENMRLAYEQIEKLIGTIVRQSAFFETEPWGFQSTHLFLNSAVCCKTRLLPREILWLTQQIEKSLGRQYKSTGGIYHDRPIDIDILLYDNWTVHEPDLIIPHPHIMQRDFVLKPLMQILFEKR